MTEQTNDNTTNECKGFSLFNDIEDSDLRNRNRAVVLANIADSTSKAKKISPNGMGLILCYFSKIDKTERKDVMSRFVTIMQERGYVLTTA